MCYHQIHIILESLFQRLLAKCFSTPNLESRIYLLLRLFSPNPVFIPKCLTITGFSGFWKPSLSHLCHWNSASLLPSWNLSLNLKPIHSWILSLKRRLRSSLTRLLQSSYTIYQTASEEQEYWDQAARGQRELRRTDARFAGTKVCKPGSEPQLPPLVTYYVPALLPVYRDTKPKSSKIYRKPYVSPKTYCKWHRMVFPGSDHPTIKEASTLRNLYDPEDMQEICRISRMLPDNVIFPMAPAPSWTWTPKYQIIWQKWLASKPLVQWVVTDSDSGPLWKVVAIGS